MTEMQILLPPIEILMLPVLILIPIYAAVQALMTLKIMKQQIEIAAAIRIIHIELQKLDPDFPKWMQKEAEEAEKDLEKI